MIPAAALIPLFDKAADLIDGLFTTDKDRADARFALENLSHQANMGQLEINSREAMHRSIFVAGWRPFIGWTCGFGLCWHFILAPMLEWIFLATGYVTADLPELDTGPLMTLTLGMLGLGGLRTLEKSKGMTK